MSASVPELIVEEKEDEDEADADEDDADAEADGIDNQYCGRDE